VTVPEARRRIWLQIDDLGVAPISISPESGRSARHRVHCRLDYPATLGLDPPLDSSSLSRLEMVLTLSDEECCDIVDAVDQAMKYVHTELKKRTENAAQYKAAATKIQQKLAGQRARREGRAGS
jgi:hypothetical protein